LKKRKGKKGKGKEKGTSSTAEVETPKEKEEEKKVEEQTVEEKKVEEEVVEEKKVEEEEKKTEEPEPMVGIRSLGKKFEKGVIRKFLLFSAAMIAFPLLTTFAIYNALKHADDIAEISPKYFGWLQQFSKTEFVSNNQIVIGGICGIIVTIIIQVTYIFVSLDEDEDEPDRPFDKNK